MKKLLILALPLLLFACVDGKTSAAENKSNDQTKAEVNAVDPSKPQSPKTTVNSNAPMNGSRGQLSTPKEPEQAPSNPTSLSSAQVSPELEAEIKRVLNLLADQDIKIGGNDIPMEAGKASKIFAVTYMKNKSKVGTWDDFVNVLINEPTTSGKPWFVIDKKITKTPLGEYLNQLHKKK